MASSGDIPPSLEADFVALRKLRDVSDCDELKAAWAGEDPREWKDKDGDEVITEVKNGRVTKLSLWNCSSLVALPAAIGELDALTTLELSGCESLAALPDAIGKLGALTYLGLKGCSSLAALPAAIGKLKALTGLHLNGCSSLTELPAAIGELGALTRLDVSNCSSLVALPDAIGGLKALTRLNLEKCSSLTALPESIAGLDALKKLALSGCTKLTFPPPHMLGDVKRIKRCLTNTTRFLDDGLSAADADDDAKADFLDAVIAHAPLADRLEEAVRKDPALADLTDAKGRRAIDLASLEGRRAMQRSLFFLGRYDVDRGPPEHRSATSLVVRAVDYEAADDYGRLFDEFDANGDGDLNSGELDRLAAKLGTNVAALNLGDETLTKALFVDKLQRLFGQQRRVAIKVFQVEEQWRNEKKARDDLGLDAQFVVQTIEAPGDDEFAKALAESALFKNKDRFGERVGSHAIVMDAADRNLFQIYQSERPDLNEVRVLMRETMECVQHLHEKGLVHSDLKMTNIVRLPLDNRLRLIDFDAAAKISAFGGDVSYVGSKFSSAVLPPECFAKLDADQVTQFDSYKFIFKDGDAELWEKVAPKVDKRGASYVVKTFSLDENGDPRNVDGLPYELVEASEAVDYWSLGALLYQLVVGEPLVPSNPDDDCMDGNAMAALASWNDNVGKKRLVVIKDAAAFDLASQLLVRDPEKRASFSITDTLARHPFFNPESGDAGIKMQLNEMQKTLNAVKADTSLILRLSRNSRDELQLTRQALLKAMFEASEVSTPTAFVILTEKLATLEELEKEPEKFAFKLREDGTGIDVEGTLVDEVEKVEKRYDEAKKWTNLFASIGKGIMKGKPDQIFKTLMKACEDLTVGKESFLYLIDELTLEPVRPARDGEVYPIRITEPSEQVAKILPVMQVGLHAASLVNGVSGVAKLFGFPLPSVPNKWREGAQESVDVLKQESSVEAFGAVLTEAQAGDEKNETDLRGKGLRELEAFFNEHDSKRDYAGLRRIGDPDDGTAVWTLVAEDDVDAKLKERSAQRNAEEKLRPKTASLRAYKPSKPKQTRGDDKDLKAQAINDSAVGGIDRYESAPLAAAIVEVLGSAGPPVCVGLLAKWGSGKSFLIHQLKRRFDPYARETPTHQLVQWFEEARDGRDAYKKLPPSDAERDEERFQQRISDRDARTDASYIGCVKGFLAWLLVPFFFCFKLGGKSWEALKPYWVDTACNILLDAWRAFTGFRTHYRDSVDLMHSLNIPTPDGRTGRQILLPSVDVESPKQSDREYIFVDFNAWEFYATEELWTGLLRELYRQVEMRLAMTRKGPIDPEPKKDWKRKWRAQTAQKKLNEQYGVVGLRTRAIVAVSTFLTWLVLILLAAIGVRAWWYGLTAFIGHAADSVANFISVVVATVGAAGLTVGSVMSAAKAKAETAKSQGDVIFDKASSGAIRNRTSFMHDAKNELNDLFEYMRKYERETGVKLIIVAFVDDLDRCIGGDKILKMLEAVQLLLSIHAAPVITFLAIDPRIVVSSIEESFTEVMRNTHVTGWEYLDKILQFPVSLQQPPAHKIRNYVAHVVDPVVVEEAATDADGFYRWLASLEFDMNRELIVFPEDDKVYNRNGLLLEYARELHASSGNDSEFHGVAEGFYIDDKKSRVLVRGHNVLVSRELPPNGKAEIIIADSGHWLIGGSTPKPKVIVLVAAMELTRDTREKAKAFVEARSDQKEEALELVCSSVRKACGSIRILNVGAASDLVIQTLENMKNTGGYYSFPCGPLGWSDLPELHGMSFDGNDSSIKIVHCMAEKCLSEKEVWGDTKADGRKSWLVDSQSSLLIDTICQKVAHECAVAGARDPVAQGEVDRAADTVGKAVNALRKDATSQAGALLKFPETETQLRWDELPEDLKAKLAAPPSPTSPTDSNAPPAEATGATDVRSIDVVRAVTPLFIKEDPEAAKPDLVEACAKIQTASKKITVIFEESKEEVLTSVGKSRRPQGEESESEDEVDKDASIQETVDAALENVVKNLYTETDRAGPPGRIRLAEEEALKLFTEKNDGNPRRIKRMVNVFQLARTVASKLKVKGDDTVVDDPRWPLFALKLIKWILLCENYPIRMSLLVLRLLDFQQKAEVNKLSKQHDVLKLEFQHRGETDAAAESMPKSDTLISEAYFKYADNYFYAHKDCQRHLQQDGDIEGFALLVSMPLPEATLKLLPPKALDADGKTLIDASEHYDITVADIVGTEDDEYFGLLKYSFNLTPAIREELSKELSSMLTEHELHYDKKLALRSESVEHKRSFVLKRDSVKATEALKSLLRTSASSPAEASDESTS